ncbi:MAG: universal stress protein [Desulfobacter sp.]|nr:MAG: universal stress protein [Desulfobacter sp.]
MTHQINKILYATDLSKVSPRFFQYAAFIANQHNAHITCLHVMEEPSQDAILAFASYLGKNKDEIMAQRGKGAIAEMETRVKKLCFSEPGEAPVDPKRLTIKVVRGYPEAEILKVSKKMEADLIVMGAHEKGVTHTFLGSVAKRVLRRSRIPVLIVPVAK